MFGVDWLLVDLVVVDFLGCVAVVWLWVCNTGLSFWFAGCSFGFD